MRMSIGSFLRQVHPLSKKIDPFLAAVSKLSMGSILGFGIAYLARPLLTRLYTPEHFGILALFVSLTAILGSISMLKMEDAIVLPEDEMESASVFKTSLLILLFSTTILCLLLPFKSNLSSLLGEPEIAFYLSFIPLSVFLLGLSKLLDSGLSKLRAFARLSGATIFQYATAVPVQVIQGISRASPTGLIFGYLAGLGASNISLISRASSLLRNWSGFQFKRDIGTYRRFPVFAAPNALAGALSMQIPAILIVYFFDVRSLGHYSQAYALVAIPIALVGSAFSKVFYVDASEKLGSEGLSVLTASTFDRLFWIGFYPSLVLILIGPTLFEFVLGQEWRQSGEIARYLSPWLFLVLVSSPLSKLFDVKQKQDKNLLFTLVLFFARAASLLYGGILGDFMLAIKAFAISSALLWLVHTIWMLRMGEADLRDCLIRIRKPMIWAVCLAIPLGLAERSIDSPISVISIAAALSLLYWALSHSKERLELTD